MSEFDGYVAKFATFVTEREPGHGLGVDDFASAASVRDLGISSLTIIVLVADYMAAHGDAGAAFDPAWVARLDTMDGLGSVIAEIDRGAPAAT